MRARDREKLQRRLDAEMRSFRRAGSDADPTNGLLKAVRTALKIPVAEIAALMGVNRSGVFELEARELKSSATLRSMSRMAEAMGCKVVYGIVSSDGETFEQMAEERRWRSALGVEKSVAEHSLDGDRRSARTVEDRSLEVSKL
jgi:hypothetical protein